MAEVKKTENVPTIKAYKNLDFLAAPGSRHIRIMCELQEPMKRLSDCEVDNYFLFVGSAFVRHPHERATLITDLEAKATSAECPQEAASAQEKLADCKRIQPMDKYYLLAMELAERLAQWSKDRKSHSLSTYHVATGGGPGIMEAANKGASSVGELTLGFGATRAEWGKMNDYVSQEAGFEFHYFFMRKFWMAYKCMGLIAFPGGGGTLDEIFELLTLLSSGKIKHRLPVILIGRDHWNKVLNFAYLKECGLLPKKHLDLIYILDTVDEVFDLLTHGVEEGDTNGENGPIDMVKRRRLHKTPSTGSAKHGDE